MSDYTAVRAVSLTLQAVLEAYITHSSDPQVKGVSIDLRSPREMELDNVKQGISLWLYRVARNGDMLNRMAPQPVLNLQAPQSLPIDLYYLVTPVHTDIRTKQALAGRVLQAFNDRSILSGVDLQDSLAGSPEELHVTLETLSVEDITRIWNALQESYRLCLPYVVQVVSIDSDRQPVQTSTVLERQIEYEQIVSES